MFALDPGAAAGMTMAAGRMTMAAAGMTMTAGRMTMAAAGMTREDFYEKYRAE
jgi:hypothetical protein